MHSGSMSVKAFRKLTLVKLTLGITSTVKLGYNELGYNKHSVITNKMFCPK